MGVPKDILIKFIAFCLILICSYIGGKSLAAREILTLDRAMEIAMANSPDIRRSQLNLERSEESLNAQKAALKSRFSLTLTPVNYRRGRQFDTRYSIWATNELKQSSGLFRIEQPLKWTDGTLALINQLSWRDARSESPFINPFTGNPMLIESSSKTYGNDLYVSYLQPLFTYNRTKMALRELELDLEQTALNYGIQKLALEQLVTQSFFDAYMQKSSLDIAWEELRNQEQSYQIIKNKVDAGLAAREEFYQAELNLATSQSRVQNQQVILANGLDGLKQLLGISLFDSVNVIADVSYQPVKVDLGKALDTGLKYRMELRQRKINIELAQFDLVQNSAVNEFRGDLELSYGVIGTDEKFDMVYETPTKNQQLVFSLEIPLWDWGAKKSRIKSSEAVIKSRQLSLEDEKNNIVIAIRKAYRNLQNQGIQIEIARQNVRNAELTYDINLERYKNGDLTSMDLNLFQTQLSQKKIDLVAAQINYKLALLDMKIQSLWDFERDESALPVVNMKETRIKKQD